MAQADKRTNVAADGASGVEQITNGVWRLRILFVNVYFIAADDGQWVLVDAGLKGSSRKITEAAAILFGHNRPPAAIILTHGHFDHIGALPRLLQRWDSPVYAHPLELPYLTGQAAYPPADPFAGGGMMSWVSFLYPNEPINLGNRVEALSKEGSLPVLSRWRYIHTPGHAPGHISLFRDTDGILIAGDAFVTTRQESAFSVLLQKKQVSGPPRYFTYDWEEAAASVKKLQQLNPLVAVTGHGKPVKGNELTDGLAHLVRHFDRIAVPKAGRYVDTPPTVNRRGIVRLPANKHTSRNRLVLASIGIAVAAGLALLWKDRLK
ncbi:Glyoxylase, beta-lactamase superfamily II [Parapedobacter composti]|uniref:Glyoxylase, beta-lactamase superfamily II n=2 Tax=Parapedobacter composti TaxID=623281 RepID=A0A1I1IJY9_9SPHI|nr:Glyoxylase, beta-lactamase superfamily II [Parapedobacter composti]